MQALAYGFFLVIVYPLSYLPYWVLYRLSDFLFLLAYHIIGYRKRVVLTNLQNSFPQKSDKEIKNIARQFYSNLCDIIVEDLKLLTANADSILKRCTFENPELITQYASDGQSAITTLGHCGNWEMCGLAASLKLPHESVTIYRPLSNLNFDRLLRKLRARFGLELVASDKSRDLISMLKNPDKVYHFITDQTPVDVQNSYWTTFLNQETPVFMGTEKIALKTNFPVFYSDIKRTKRGRYHITFKLITDNPSNCKSGEISEKHTQLLEQSIHEQPDNWLWSHRRWKRKRPDGHQNPK